MPNKINQNKLRNLPFKISEHLNNNISELGEIIKEEGKALPDRKEVPNKAKNKVLEEDKSELIINENEIKNEKDELEGEVNIQ